MARVFSLLAVLQTAHSFHLTSTTRPPTPTARANARPAMQQLQEELPESLNKRDQRRRIMTCAHAYSPENAAGEILTQFSSPPPYPQARKVQARRRAL